MKYIIGFILSFSLFYLTLHWYGEKMFLLFSILIILIVLIATDKNDE